MQDLKEVHQLLNKKKQERKIITDALREALAQSKPYQDALAKMQEFKVKKDQIETFIKADFYDDLKKADALGLEIKDMAQIVSDIAINQIAKGQDINLEDDAGIKYEPVIKVTFKRA